MSDNGGHSCGVTEPSSMTSFLIFFVYAHHPGSILVHGVILYLSTHEYDPGPSIVLEGVARASHGLTIQSGSEVVHGLDTELLVAALFCIFFGLVWPNPNV